MDNLENFIKQNRNAFDEEPPATLWNKIAEELAVPTRKTAPIVQMMPVRSVWQIAAGFAALMVVGLALQWSYFSKQQGQLAALQTPPTVEQLVPELGEAEKFYAMQISQTQVALKKYQANSGNQDLKIDQEAMKELENLDKTYTELKKEFYTSGNQEAVVSALIQNLQLRLDLLTQQLQALQKAEKAKNGVGI